MAKGLNFVNRNSKIIFIRISNTTIRMELARLDLNLLLVFHHLLREQRVSRVALVLGMS